ncbi:MAG TPA: hypothetical protein VKP60_17840 [Magnetospirillaceae bacterium]|nr:hypothetical protein [Magnetospirillaceae bacterium]
MKIALMMCGGALALMGQAARAAPVSPLEVKIELRVLDFISEPVDRSVVAVLYDRDRAASAEEAAAILKALQDSVGLARYKIAPRVVEIHSLAGLKGVKAAILTAGLDDAAVLKYGVANQTLVLSSGTACAKDHRCMVGVTTVPEVEIGVNLPAIEAAHIRFADGFELMVKEY